MNSVVRRALAFAIVAVFLLCVLPTVATRDVQAVTLDTPSWQSYAEATNVRYNQTVMKNKIETRTELGLAATLHSYQYNSDPFWPGIVKVPVTIAVNTRHSMSWNVYPLADNFPSTWWDWSTLSTVSLTDDQGYYVDINALRTGSKILFYGKWYDSMMICSNGYVILDKDVVNYKDANNKVTDPKWVSYQPVSFPNTANPNCMIAPLWRDLNPAAGGQIKYGFIGSTFVVIWKNVPNFAGTGLQTFAVAFYHGSWGWEPFSEIIRFHYKSITKDVTTTVGVETQNGKAGYTANYGTNVNSGRMLEFYPDLNSMYVVKQVQLIATKYDASGTKVDSQAYLHLTGPGGKVPGGFNLKWIDPSRDYQTLETIDTAMTVTGLALDAVTYIAASSGVGLPLAGLIQGGKIIVTAWDLLKLFTKSERVTFDPDADPVSEPTDKDVNVVCGSNDEDRPLQPFNAQQAAWDGALTGLIEWKFKNPTVAHVLKIQAKVLTGVCDSYYYDSYSTEEITLRMEPQQSPDAAWLGRTIAYVDAYKPDAHYMNFYPVSTPWGTGYHVDSTGMPTGSKGYSDYGYHMMGWTKLSPDISGDYKVGNKPVNGVATGYLRVSGYFNQYDTFSSTEAPGRRLVNAYVMYSETGPWGSPPNFGSLNKIVCSAPILDSTVPVNTWTWKSVTMSTSSLAIDKFVKIGVGRPDMWAADMSLKAEWAQVRAISNPNMMRLDSWRMAGDAGSVTLSSPGLTSHTTYGSFDEGLNKVWTATAINSGRWVFDKWVVNGATITTNPYTFTLTTDTSVLVYFRLSGGGGCVLEGTEITLPDGSTTPVEELKKGSAVQGYDTAKDSFVIEQVLSCKKSKVDRIEIINNGLLYLTLYDQPMYVRHDGFAEWVKNPVEFNIGWELFNPLENKWIPITSIELRDGSFTVYDLQATGPNNYIANGILADAKTPY